MSEVVKNLEGVVEGDPVTVGDRGGCVPDPLSVQLFNIARIGLGHESVMEKWSVLLSRMGEAERAATEELIGQKDLEPSDPLTIALLWLSAATKAHAAATAETVGLVGDRMLSGVEALLPAIDERAAKIEQGGKETEKALFDTLGKLDEVKERFVEVINDAVGEAAHEAPVRFDQALKGKMGERLTEVVGKALVPLDNRIGHLEDVLAKADNFSKSVITVMTNQLRTEVIATTGTIENARKQMEANVAAEVHKVRSLNESGIREMVARVSWKTVLLPGLIGFGLGVGLIALIVGSIAWAGGALADSVTQKLLSVYVPSGPPPAVAKSAVVAGSGGSEPAADPTIRAYVIERKR